jgi:hypothetical protein
MLYLFNPQEIEGVTVYPDSHEDYVFYALPPYPRFRRTENGQPVFQLIKYRGGEASTAPQAPATNTGEGSNDEMTANAVPTIDGEVAGGFLIFDTEYTVDEPVKEKIRQTLDAQVRAKYLREGRVVPEGFQIVLRQPTWTDGDVRLLLEDTAQGFFTCVSKSGKPSLMGNNVASFAAVLQPWQASVLEQAVTSANFSPIQVNYHLKYLAKLPPVRIRIYASASDFYAMYKQYGTEINGGGACSDPDTVIRSVSQHVVSRDVVRITIDSGGLTIDDKTFMALQEMALGMLQDWIKQEFVKPPPERATKEQIENIQLRQLTESDFRNLDIRIEQSATAELSVYPQGTMGKLIAEGEDLSQYILEVDLSQDQFYQNREVGIKVYTDFPASGATPLPTDILFVEVTAYYGDGAGQSMTWDAAGGGSSLANGGRWQVKWHKVPDVNEVRWEARVRFRDPTHEYTLSGTSDKTDINIPVATPGRARLRLDHVGMPWNIVQYIEAKVLFRQGDADPQEVERSFIIEEQSDEQWFDEAIWTKRTQPFFATLTYRLKNGNEIQQAEHRNIEVKGDRLDIKSPFDQYLDVPIQGKWTYPTWIEDIIDLEYRDDANQYVMRGQVFLSEKGGLRQTWSVPLLNPAKRSFKYFWTRRNQEGGIFTSQDVPGAPPDGWFPVEGNSVVITGDPNANEDMLRVVVDPVITIVGMPDGAEVIRAVVHMAYQPAAGQVDVDDHIFNKGDTAWTWKQHIKDLNSKRFRWWAEYYLKPFRRVAMGTSENPFESEAETVILEPPQ